MTGNTSIIQLNWSGITIEITWCPDWSKPYRRIYGHPLAHLEIKAVNPVAEPLPITATGYRSHFCALADVEAYGGPPAYVRAWLYEAASTPQWGSRQEAARQLSLFSS